MKKLLPLIAACLFGFLGHAQEIFDMPNASSTFLTGINDAGEICGYYVDTTTGNTRAFAIDKYGDTLNIAFPGNYTYCTANGINNQGLIVGTYGTSSSVVGGFIYYPFPGRNNNGTYVNVTGSWGGTDIYCSGISDDTCVSGGQLNGTNHEAQMWCQGNTVPVAIRCENQGTVYPTYGYCVNVFNNVGGFIIQGATEQAMVYYNAISSFDTFAIAGSTKSRIYGSNDSSYYCGNYNSQTAGFICKKLYGQNYSNFKKISVPDAITIFPTDLNNKKEVVGYYTTSTGQIHGFIYAAYDIGYRPSVNGYGLKNSKTFPESYYDTLSYVNDPYLNVGPFPKPNGGTQPYSNWNYPTWPDFAKTMPVAQSYIIKNGKTYIRERSFLRWDSKKGAFNGACYGMALTSIMMYDSLNWYLNRWPASQPDAVGLVIGYPATNPILSAIHQGWAMQFTREMDAYQDAHAQDNVATTVQKLKQSLRNSLGRPHPVLLMNFRAVSGAHALVPFRISSVLGQPGMDSIFVYDCNFPGMDTLCILAYSQVGTGSGSWSYSANGNYTYADGTELDYGFGGAPSLGLSVTQPDTAYLSPLHLLIETPFAGNHNPLITRSSSPYLIDYNDSSVVEMTDDSSANAYFSVDSTSGTSLLLAVNNYTGADSTEATTIKSTSGITTIHKTNSPTAEKENFVMVSSDSYIVRCDRYSGTDSTDNYAAAFGSLTYLNKNTTVSDTINYTVSVDDSDNEYNYYITNLGVPANNKVTVTTYTNNGMVLQNYGPATSYIITTQFIIDSLHTFSDTINIAANTQHIIQPHDTTHSGIYILVDNGMDGTYEDTIFINSTISDINHINAPNIAAWPVPGNSVLNMSGPKGLISYAIVDMMGRTITTGQMDFAGGETKQFDISNYGPGIYIIRGNGLAEKWNYMFVKQ